MKKIITIALVLSIPLIVFADIYKWTDEQGTIHFSDTPVEFSDNAEQIQGNNNTQRKPYTSKIPIRPPDYYRNQNQKQPYPMPMTKGLEEARKIMNIQAEQAIKKTANILGTIILIGTIYTIIWLITIFDILKSQFYKNDKLIWFLAATMTPLFGIMAYVLYGRKQKIIIDEFD